MFNRGQEAARRRRQMGEGNARVDEMRGYYPRRTAAGRSYDNGGRDAVEVQAPKKGGTFFYCDWQVMEKGPGGITKHSCAGGSRYGIAVPSRFRTLAAYRRHYRNWHSW